MMRFHNMRLRQALRIPQNSSWDDDLTADRNTRECLDNFKFVSACFYEVKRMNSSYTQLTIKRGRGNWKAI